MERMAIGAFRTQVSLLEVSVRPDCTDGLRDRDGGRDGGREGVWEGVGGSADCITCDNVGWMNGIWVTVLALSTPIASTMPY